MPAKSKSGRLGQARDALVADDAPAALAMMLAAWLAVPAPALADAIELVGERAARGLHPPAGVTAADRDDAWHAAAALGDPVMRHRLIATVTDVHEDTAKIARLEALVRTRDPRLARAIVAMLDGPHVSVRHDIPTIWRPLCKLLVACGDPRVRAAVEAIDWTPRTRRLAIRARSAAEIRIAKLRAQLAAAYPDDPPRLAPSEAALVDAIVTLAAAPAPTAARDAEIEAGLLAAIYATPDEDGPRAIYADWLQERGDPRGELIALQLARDPRAHRYDRTPASERIAELLEQHRVAWLGSLGSGLARSVTFERGFLATCAIGWADERRTRHHDTPPDPAWATVRAIRGGIPATDAYPMPILTEALDLDARAIVALGTLATPPPLVALGFRSTIDDWSPTSGYRADTARAIEAFADTVERIPTLRRLDLIGAPGWASGRMRPDQLGWRWRDTSIRQLRVSANLDQLAAWFAIVLHSELDVFELVAPTYPHGPSVELDRDAARHHGSVVIDLGLDGYAFDAELAAIATAIERLPRDWLAELEMKVPAKDLWTLPNRRRMAAALDHHPGLRAPEIYGFTRPKR